MNPIFAAIFISIDLLIFSSFLNNRIDGSLKWNWFCVFIPLFFLQTLFLFNVVILFGRNYGCTSYNKFKLAKIFLLGLSLVFVFAFEILLCLKLEYYKESLKLTYVFIPFWALLCICIVFLFVKLSK
jgi:hypothetical protein